MRFRFACVVAPVFLAGTACVDVEFATGGTGGTGTATDATGTSSSTSTTMTGSGGAAATSGSGGATTTGSGGATTTTTTTTSTTSGGGDCTNKRCGPDGNGGLCGGVDMQPKWGASLPGEALAIVPWPETQSVFVATVNDAIVRVDECDGSIMASQLDTSTIYNRPALFGLAFDGAQLMAVGANTPDLDNPDRRFYLSPTTLAVTSSDLLANQFGNTGGGAFADASGLWANLKEGSQGYVPFAGNECSQKFTGYGSLQGRGVVKTATGLYALKWDTGSGRTTVVGSLGSCASTCTCPNPIDVLSAVGVLDNDVVDSGAELVLVGTSSMTDSRMVRINPTTLAINATLEFDVSANGQDSLLTAVAQGGFVYAGGATGLSSAQAYLRAPIGGTALLLRAPTNFTASTVPVAVQLTGGARVRDTAADATGIYVGGANTAPGGFLVKCTTAPECGAVP